MEYDGYNNEEEIGPYDEGFMYETPSSGYKMSEALEANLYYLRRAINDGNLSEMQNIYESSLTNLIDNMNTTLPHPNDPVMMNILGDDDLFQIIYKEIYYRQIYATQNPSLEDRFNSYYNYVDLFNYILTSSGPVSLELPNQWLWEIMDDFIYQFQCFSIYLSKFDQMKEEEIAMCRAHPKMWNVHSVLNVLHSLVQKSNINQQLEVYSNGGNPDDVAGEYGSRSLYKMLGYFSLIALLRLHSQLGDYYQAIKVLQHLELNRKGLSRVPACHVTTYYYVGFAYMMMRRYGDAIRTFSNVLVYILRTKATLSQSRGYQQQQMLKQMDRMFALLSICMVLHPQRTDESVLAELKAKHNDITLRMSQGDTEAFERQFMHGCPRFLSPVNPFNYDFSKMSPEARQLLSKQAQLQQWYVFRSEVALQLDIPDLRGYLKLYTTMPVEKLAKFIVPVPIGKDCVALSEPETQKHYHRQLMCYKHLMSTMMSPSNSGSLDGEFQSGADMDFFIDKDMIHVADTKVARKYGEHFIRQFHKFEEMHDSVKKLQIRENH